MNPEIHDTSMILAAASASMEALSLGEASFCVAFLVMSFGALLSWVASRDRCYLYYFAYVASIFVVATGRSGVLATAFPSAPFRILLGTAAMAHVSGTVAMIYFVLEFFETRSRYPRANRLLRSSLLYFLAIGLAIVVAPPSWVDGLVAMTGVGSSTILGSFMLLMAFKENKLAARVYAASWVVLVSAIAVYSVSIFGHAASSSSSSSWWQNHAIEMGLTAEMILLAVALALRARSFLLMKVRMEGDLVIQRASAVNASKMAEIGQFAASIAHDIASPLFAIEAVISILKKRATESSTTLDHKMVLHLADSSSLAIEHASSLIRSLKRVLRSESSDSPKTSTSVDALLGDVTTIHRGLFAGAGVDLEVEPPAIDETIACRPGQIARVLFNLLGNALDAAKQGGDGAEKWVKVRAEFEGEGGSRRLRISVSDSGRGVPRDIRPRIMEQFFSTKPLGKGTGLGLAIASDLVASHDGKLWLEPDAPHTTFVVELPVGPRAS